MLVYSNKDKEKSIKDADTNFHAADTIKHLKKNIYIYTYICINVTREREKEKRQKDTDNVSLNMLSYSYILKTMDI